MRCHAVNKVEMFFVSVITSAPIPFKPGHSNSIFPIRTLIYRRKVSRRLVSKIEFYVGKDFIIQENATQYS